MYASEIESYLEYLATRFGDLGGAFTEGPTIYVDYRDNVGNLDFQMKFHDGSRLDVGITSAGPRSYPDWLDYTIHYMDSDDQCIIRYDNAPHHMGVYFPDHKHVGDQVQDRPRPTLSQILNEIRAILYGA